MNKISNLTHLLLGLIIVLTLIAADDGCAPSGYEEESAATSTVEVEGEHLVDLIEQNKVEARSTGSGIDSVSLAVRRLVDHEVLVMIPAGTFFTSGGSVQDMVTTDQEVLVLTDDGWVSADLDAACADMELDVPDTDVTFGIQRAPQQQELEMLMPVLRDAGVSYDVRQAAVWIVTDDADYDDLGTLVSDSGFGGPRSIQEIEAAQAMGIVEEAGIDITLKAIWQDRNLILEGLEDEGIWVEGFRDWLQQRAN